MQSLEGIDNIFEKRLGEGESVPNIHEKVVGYFYRMMESNGAPYFHVTTKAITDDLKIEWDDLTQVLAELPEHGYMQFNIVGGSIPCPHCLGKITVLTVQDVEGVAKLGEERQ